MLEYLISVSLKGKYLLAQVEALKLPMLEYLISVSLKGKYLLAQGEALGHKVGFNRSPERASQHPANAS
jgi:hypothetical protein